MDDQAAGREQARLLGAALHRAGIEIHGLWLQAFRLGGNLSELEIEAYLHHCLHLDPFHRDLLAHAANHLIDQLPPPRAPYSTELLFGHRRDPDPGSPPGTESGSSPTGG
ncbi:hypothetical protein [Kocuria sp. KH4]